MPLRKKRSGKSSSIKKALKRERHLIENGRVFKVPTHPPEFTAIPWNQCTIRSQQSAAVYDHFAVITLLRSQLHLTSNQGISYRLHSARVWAGLVAFNAGPLVPMRVRFYSLNESSANPTFSAEFATLEDVIDYPDQTRRAAVGFEWPLAQQSLAFSTSVTQATPPLLEITEGSVGSVVYFRLWWRPTVGPYVPSLNKDNVSSRPQSLSGTHVNSIPQRPPRRADSARSLRSDFDSLSLHSNYPDSGGR